MIPLKKDIADAASAEAYIAINIHFCCLSFFEDCHQSRYSSCCFLRGSSLDLFALSRNSSIFSEEAKSPQLLHIKFLLVRSYFSSPPHSGQKLAN